MRKKRIIILSLLAIVLVTSGFLFYTSLFQKNDKEQGSIRYDYEKSYHKEFYFENGYIVFVTTVKLRNTSPKDLYFYMYADVNEDNGLVIEKSAIACEKESIRKQKFFIKAKTEKDFAVYFKAKKGTKSTKQNRLPPKDIKFEIL